LNYLHPLETRLAAALCIFPLGSKRLAVATVHAPKTSLLPCNPRGSEISPIVGRLLMHLSDVDRFELACSDTLLSHDSWLSSTSFCDLLHVVSEIGIIHHQETSWSSEVFHQEQDPGRAYERLLLPLLWHLCLLKLLRTFLPIPDTRCLSSTNQNHITGTISAPMEFIEEQINVCRSSAALITTICSEAVGCNHFILVGPLFNNRTTNHLPFHRLVGWIRHSS
jgi:hypothetical protein